MKELKKLALILRALGITAKVVSEPICFGSELISDNTFCVCKKGNALFDVWHEQTNEFELHFTFKNTLVYDTLYLDSLIQVVSEITSTPDDTLDSVPNEHLASEKCTEQTITPPTKENVSERKETTSTAKVVTISIGVPSCLDIPPNNMRLDIAANKPLNAAVGDCLCGVGKVVHTLPLPPPRSKGMSELITYTNFYNTS